MKRLELLDYARLVAALAVVAMHYLHDWIQSGALRGFRYEPLVGDVAGYGYMGVDFFFMISGYVIFFSAKGRTLGEFAAARAQRLYPAFWMCVFLTTVIVSALGYRQFTAREILLNLSMLPTSLGAQAVDGVHWSLRYEIVFYAMIGAALLAGLRKRLDKAVLAWVAIIVLAWAAGYGGWPLVGSYFPLFGAGALFAMMRNKVTPVRLALAGALLLICALGSMERALGAAAIRDVVPSGPVVAIIIAALFAFFFALNTRRGQALKLAGSRLAGALTYPVYLLHNMIGLAIMQRFFTEDSKAIGYLIALSVTLALAYLVHILAERRLAAFWRSFFDLALRRPLDGFEHRGSL